MLWGWRRGTQYNPHSEADTNITAEAKPGPGGSKRMKPMFHGEGLPATILCLASEGILPGRASPTTGVNVFNTKIRLSSRKLWVYREISVYPSRTFTGARQRPHICGSEAEHQVRRPRKGTDPWRRMSHRMMDSADARWQGCRNTVRMCRCRSTRKERR